MSRLISHASVTVILVINVQHSTPVRFTLPLGSEPPVNARKPGWKRLYSVDDRIVHVTIHPAHIRVGFAIDGDAERMDAMSIGLP
jgi:hypothetical protein